MMQGLGIAIQCISVCGICHTLVQTSHQGFLAGLGIVQVTVCTTKCASKSCQRQCVQCMKDLFLVCKVHVVAALMLCMQTDTFADRSPHAAELADGPIQLLA